MKTPRQILFERHQHANLKLDAVRHNALAGLTQDAKRTTQLNIGTPTSVGSTHRPPSLLPTEGVPARSTSSMREFVRGILSLRWHLAGMSAAWLIVAWLNSDSMSASPEIAAKKNSPSPREVLMALRENRRQILELLDSPMSEPSPAPQPVAPPRRSGLESTNAIA